MRYIVYTAFLWQKQYTKYCQQHSRKNSAKSKIQAKVEARQNLKRIDIKSDYRASVFGELVNEGITVVWNDLSRIPNIQFPMLCATHQQTRGSAAAIHSIWPPDELVKPAAWMNNNCIICIYRIPGIQNEVTMLQQKDASWCLTFLCKLNEQKL